MDLQHEWNKSVARTTERLGLIYIRWVSRTGDTGTQNSIVFSFNNLYWTHLKCWWSQISRERRVRQTWLSLSDSKHVVCRYVTLEFVQMIVLARPPAEQMLRCCVDARKYSVCVSGCTTDIVQLNGWDGHDNQSIWRSIWAQNYQSPSSRSRDATVAVSAVRVPSNRNRNDPWSRLLASQYARMIFSMLVAGFTPAGRRTDFSDKKSSDFSWEIFRERNFGRSITAPITLFPLIGCGVDSFSPN